MSAPDPVADPTDDARPDKYIEGRVFMTTIAFLSLLVLAAGAAGYLLPAGEYQAITEAGETTRRYVQVDPAPVPIWRILLAPLLVLGSADGPKLIVLILFILLIGGSFSVLDRGGVLPTLLRRLAHRFAEKRTRLLVANSLAFCLIGSTLGILEELVPLILLYVPLARRFGWGPEVGMAIPFLSAVVGFSAATFNPFTVGIAQQLAEVPLFSGVGFRMVLWVISATLLVLFLLWRTRGATGEGPPLPAPVEGDGPDLSKALPFMIICLVAVAGVVAAGTQISIIQDLAFPLIALIFLVMGIGGGLLAGVGGGTVGRLFGRGLLDFAPAVLLILLAGSVGFLIREAKVMDTVLHALVGATEGWSAGASAVALYFTQMVINLAVPSGSGQAALTIPILAPLGDLLGVSRQTVVLAFQCGDGFSNAMWPTNPVLLIALGLSGLSWRAWFKWILPLQLVLMAVSIGALLLAVQIGYS